MADRSEPPPGYVVDYAGGRHGWTAALSGREVAFGWQTEAEAVARAWAHHDEHARARMAESVPYGPPGGFTFKDGQDELRRQDEIRRSIDQRTSPPSPPPIILDDVKRLDVKPGDTLVLTVPGWISDKQFDEMRRRFADEFGGTVRVLVLENGMHLEGVIGGLPAKPHGQTT